MKGKIIIIGGGPAGLTAAIEILNHSSFIPVVFEEDKTLGGISKTINYKGNRIDIGGHRFFTKNLRVQKFWDYFMPYDVPDDVADKMLKRTRLSRIFYKKKFFNYPITLSFSTFVNLGFKQTIIVGLGYLSSFFKKKENNNLENFYINRFGKPLYELFFEKYTEKVWGYHPKNLSSDWGSQRIKNLSISKSIVNAINKKLNIEKRKIETSLIDSFYYPKYGPGQLWEKVGAEIENKSGKILRERRIIKILIKDDKVYEVIYRDKEGVETREACDVLFSSLPLKELIESLEGIAIPDEIKEIAQNLKYRDFITVGLLVKELNVKNNTKFKTFKNRIADTWIYIQDPSVKIGRLQIFNNWSPYMVKDINNTEWIGLEYFCSEGDELWNLSENDFIKMAITELNSIGFVSPENVLDSILIKVKKAYPAYVGSYYQLEKLRTFINNIENLYCIGRNGQHRYNNMDHSMLTAMEAVDLWISGNKDKTSLWKINTEEDYCEKK